MKRDFSIDIFKGLLVIGMVLVHIMQFFSDQAISPSVEYVINIGNVITFSGFVFCFGYVAEISYLERDLKNVYRKIIKNSIKTLIAFYVSGSAFQLFVAGSQIEWNTFKEIILLNTMPGWSEFLASFAYFSFVTLILFVPFKKVLSNKILFWIIFFSLFLTCFIPYEKVTINQLGVLIGTNKFAAFPVLQYMPFYMLGMYFEKYDIKFNLAFAGGALLLSVYPLYEIIVLKAPPCRFPPSIAWIVAPMFILYLYYLTAIILERFALYLSPIIAFGQNVLFCLVVSNIFIFTLDSKFNKLTLKPLQCLYMEVIFLAIVYYLVSIVSKIKKSSDNIIKMS
ncbi:hypothetical protein JHL18_02315 [Clostridium sp. YIM B02505]|uniref:Heparan-alpha-glucosaminide N-acetyltransferase catalytic domain-containing protein n=1 Tax=Clostridium yunnanense TaxID=2800325 RepID=A0ABS1EJE7_9CLOT|nr:hypothetical protein [Clostridium yunnanense]MBK1809480.1 hypothetical protein [Clostridium yunnanense]